MKAATLTILTALVTSLGCPMIHAQPSEPLQLTELTQEDASLSRHFTVDDHQLVLTISEGSGLTITSSQSGTIAHWPGSFSQADLRQTVSAVDIVALDSNTSDVQLLSYLPQEKKFVKNAQLSAGDADIEAVCLFNGQRYTGFYTADARGVISEYALSGESHGHRLIAVRNFNAAPGVKSCAVAEASGELFLADEHVGVWAYPLDPESDAVRKLIFHDSQVSVEGIAALSSGEVFWVSPDKSGFWRLGDDTSFWPFTQTLEPEAVAVSHTGERLVVSVFDDKTQRSFSTTVPVGERAAASQQVSPEHFLTAVAQTDPVKRYGDAADDPAIWINKAKPEQSLVLGTDKKAGLNVYNLDGEQIQHLAVGRVNNVDVRYNWKWQDRMVDLAAASNRTTNSIDVFAIDRPTGHLSKIGQIQTPLADVYGLCLYQNQNNVDVLINATDGTYARYRLMAERDAVEGNLLETFKLPSQPEGCVVNDTSHELFFGEEEAGVWLRDLTRPAATMKKIAGVNNDVHADIEGMGLIEVDGVNYLIVSSQGNNRFAIYDSRAPYTLLGTFGIEMDLEKGIDGVTETDGLAVTGTALGDKFPQGLLVVQDGHNILPTDKQNFKLVDGAALKQLISRIRTR